MNPNSDRHDLPTSDDLQEAGVVRALAWHEKEAPGYQVSTEELKGIALAELRLMFGVSEDDPVDPPMYGCYEVKPHHVKRLQECVEIEIDLDLYDFYVEAYQRGT